MLRRSLITCLGSFSILFAACSGPPVTDSDHGSSPVSPVGSWRAVLASPGGDLPFRLEIEDGEDGLQARAVTGEEALPFSAVTWQGDSVTLEFAWYDSEITARLSGDGETLIGEWRKTVPAGNSRLPFEAFRGDDRRFLSLSEAGLVGGDSAALPSVEGNWAVEFTDDSGTEAARGEFHQQGARVDGTFLTATGDYRFLQGTYEEGLLRLSTFDGAHAFLFHAQSQGDGTLNGDFWSRDTYHATWEARRVPSAAEAPIPDAWSLVGLTHEDARFAFEFPDLQGRKVSLADERFDGKVVLVNIFGSWCPNCNDEAPLLARWDRRFRDDGLEIVGLAYEFSGDAARDGALVERFAERHGIEYPLLLAGTSDKAAAAKTLPDLSAVVAFPTSVFIDRNGKVRRIHSGFSGPGTGAPYQELIAEFENLLAELLSETQG